MSESESWPFLPSCRKAAILCLDWTVLTSSSSSALASQQRLPVQLG